MRTGTFINGEWITPASGPTIENRNPANPQDLIGTYVGAGSVEVDQAVQAATKAFSSWNKTPAPERGRLFFKAIEIAKAEAVVYEFDFSAVDALRGMAEVCFLQSEYRMRTLEYKYADFEQ